MTRNPNPQLNPLNLAMAIRAYFDADSPVAFLPSKDPEYASFVGIREGQLTYGAVPCKTARDRERLVRLLRSLGLAVSDVGQDIAVQLKAAAVDHWLSRDPRECDKIEAWFEASVPYAFTQLRSGKWLALNRYYKPLGMPASCLVDYDDFDSAAETFLHHPGDAIGVWTATSLFKCWLYNDHTESRRGYFTRLLALLDEHTTLPVEVAQAG